MVFNVVACFIQGKEESELERYLAQSLGSGSKVLAEVFTVQVLKIERYSDVIIQNQDLPRNYSDLQLEKSRFKVGTLDSLMELNETLKKVDQTLDSTVKKIEKQAKDMVDRDFKIEVTKQQKGRQMQNARLISFELPLIIVQYFRIIL